MTLVWALITVPFAVGACLGLFRSDLLRTIVVAGATLAICAGTVFLAVAPASMNLAIGSGSALAVHSGMTAVEIAMGLYLLYVGWQARRPLIVVLVLAQSGLMLLFDGQTISHGAATEDLFVDKLALVMALINGLVGSGICLYALGYMREYHETAHREIVDRRPLFFALLFVFMGAMFGLVFSNNLAWLFFFWEITTLCSFLLIGYTRTDEARRNALRALAMNLAGGLAFAIAIVWCQRQTGTHHLQTLIVAKPSLVLLPAALLCFAGMTKSAQLPFSRWLLGAMVAPTPVSALLHSSTMVKAGVYLVLRMAPIVTGTKVGFLVALVGGITFVIGSLAAITTSEAKRLLAWSTVANLGLIVLCGGLGTSEALWAGVLLIVFHAVAKCLLFLGVGMVEHKLHSRDIEAMSGLVLNMPRVAAMMLIGMAGMFLAPFGMLISKWAVLKAVVDASPILSVFIVFGSSATLFFWAKWMGKLIEAVEPRERLVKELSLSESIPLYGLAGATLATCLFFPLISSQLVEPYVRGLYGRAGSLGEGNLMIMSLMMVIVLLFPAGFLSSGRNAKVVEPYLSGANLAQNSMRFAGSAGATESVAMQNYYLRNVLSDAWLSRWGVMSCGTVLGVMLVLACL
jgi:ech hydrogenase subunit A